MTRVEVPSKYPPILFDSKGRHKLWMQIRYKALKGGRGSAKSHSIASVLLERAGSETLRILCAREIQRSIKDSVHKLLRDKINGNVLFSQKFVVTQTGITCPVTGSEFLFAGLKHNIDEIKSMEGIDIVWVEEAQKVSKESWKTLIPTIRKKGSEIWMSYNPVHETDPTDMLANSGRPDVLLIEMNWEDNPWFANTELVAEKDYDYRVDPETAAHVWGGQYLKNSKAQILAGKYVVESFEPHPTWHGPYFGADWGFAQDPTTLVKLWLNAECTKLYLEHEAYGIKVENQEIATLFGTVPDALILRKDDEGKLRPIGPQFVIRGDCSRPETINYVNHYGFNVVSCVKWSGCVEDGITWLRNLEQIVIHPRCKHAEEEARLYRYKVDKVTGDVLPIIVDAHNHIWDPVRYAMEPAILQTRESLVEAYAPMPSMSPELDQIDEPMFSSW